MKSFAALLLCLLLGSVASAAELSEAAVTRLMSDVDRAVAAHDAAGIERFLAADVSIVVNVDIGAGPQRLTLDRADYLSMLRKMWAEASAYSYKRLNQRIELLAGQAVVTADVLESVTLDGRKMDTRSRETTTVELVDGKPKATSIRVTSRAVPTEVST